MSIRYFLAGILLLALPLPGRAQYKLRQAAAQESLFNYAAARSLYAKVYKKKQSPVAARALAQIYRDTRDFENAEAWYGRLVALPGHTAEDELQYAQVLMNNAKYDSARLQLQSYAGKAPNDARAQRLLQGCDSARYWLQHPVDGALQNMEGLNSKWSDWGLMPLHEQFIFASDRPYDSVYNEHFFSTRNVRRNFYNFTGNAYLHLYTSDGKDAYSVSPLPRTVNGDYHSANPSFTGGGEVMYYAATEYVKKKGHKKTDSVYTLHTEIYQRVWDSTRRQWGPVVPFKYNASFHYSLGDPWVTEDGQTLYFAADSGASHQDGMDIYFSQKDANGEWGTPQNMGPEINSSGNDRSPYLAPDGTFYFASDGHTGMGGLDIFKATKNAGGTWTVQNMGSPVNSPRDDFSPYTTGTVFYLSSNRVQGKGSDDLYSFLPAPVHIPVKTIHFALQGHVKDAKTQATITDAHVTLINGTNGSVYTVISDQGGYYYFPLDSVTDYTVGAQKHGYGYKRPESLTTKGLTASTVLEQDLYLEEFVVGKPIRLDNVYFDLDKSNIRPDAAAELDKLVVLLKENPTWNIEMASHTDSRASDAYNLQLSQRRAASTVRYLVDHGIDPKRLTAKGYGETRLVNGCANGVKCTEAEHQQNRRTEFTILSE